VAAQRIRRRLSLNLAESAFRHSTLFICILLVAFWKQVQDV
jgi:hypothetical protein